MKYSDEDLVQLQELAAACTGPERGGVLPERHIPRLEEALQRHIARQERRLGTKITVTYRYITGYWSGDTYEPNTCCTYLKDETGKEWCVWYNVDSWRRTT